MRKLITAFFLIGAILLLNYNPLSAQCNGTPCQIPEPQVNAQNACILPGPSALDCYYGATTNDAPESFPPSWCSAIHNNHWFAFTADATTATFDITTFGCASGNGIQAAVLSTTDCIDFAFVSPCLGDIPSGSTATLTATGLTVGEVYYLCIDGSGGALCDYAINAPNPTVNGPTSGLCVPSSVSATYTVTSLSNWQIQPPTAGNINGPTLGTSVNVTWAEPGPAQICATSTSCPDAPEVCLDVIIGEDITSVEHVDVCQGYSIECAGNTYTQAGSFFVNLPSYLNCDSIINCVVHLIPTVNVTQTVYMCQGGSVVCAEEEFFAPGNYPVMFTNYQGCDSIVTCKVNQINTYIGPMQFINICGPAEYFVCDNSYTISGVYSEICTSYRGCDSIVNINLAILDPVSVIATPDTLNCTNNVTISLNGSNSSVNTAVGGATLYKWTGPGIVGFNNQPNVTVNQPGEYCLIVTHSRGGVVCSDTSCVDVYAISAVPQAPQVSGNATPCGDSTLVYTAMAGGTPLPSSYVWSIPGNVPFTQLSANTIQITWDTVVSGQICITANNACGASQPACMPLTVQPPIQQPALAGPTSVCAGGGNYNFILNLQQTGVNYNWTVPSGATFSGSGDTIQVNFLNSVSGQVCVTPQNACGIGTPVCQNVQVQPVPSADLSSDVQICAGESVNLNFALSGNGPFDVTWSVDNQTATLNDIVNGHSISVTPAQTTKYKLLSISDNSAPACALALADSVTVTVRPNYNVARQAQLCEGESLFVGGANQTLSGVYTDSLNSVFGCDSVIVTTLTVFTIDTTILTTTTCDPSQAGNSVVTFTQLNGCDSVVVQSVTLLPSDTTLIFDTNCDVANVGVFTQNLQNTYGCDSTVITTITYSLSDTTYIAATDCDPAATGVFYNNLVTQQGCDSLIITTISLLPKDTIHLTASSCNPNQTGVFFQSFTNQFGCDSTIITTVALAPLDTTFLTAANCDPAMTGVFVTHLTTPGGCDSVLVTTVSLLPESTTQVSAQSCDPSQVGVFTSVLSNQWGCDSTVVRTVTLLPSNTTNLSAQSCNPAEVGVFPTLLSNQWGCDSTVILTVTLAPLDTTFLTATTCIPTSAGVNTVDLVTPGGCDSIVVTSVSLLPSSQTAFETFTCDAAQAGVFVYPLINQWGCDSIVTETKTLLPSTGSTINLTTCNVTEVGTDIQVVSNQYGCDSTITTITTLLPPNNCSVAATLVGANIPCGANTGALTLTMTVGTAPFTYTVLQGANQVATGTVNSLNAASAIPGLPAGTYTVNITSPNGFSTSSQASLVQLQAPTLSVAAASNFTGFDVSCTGAADGSALATAGGGQQPYQFAWSNGQTTQQASGLTAGIYTVTVTDNNTCTNVNTVVLDEPTPILVGFVVNDLDCFDENNGAILVQASGGAAPYTYTLNSNPAQNSNSFNGLTAGAYTIVIEDANHCEQTEAIVVDAAVPMDVELGENIEIGQGDEAVLQAVVNVPLDSILSVVWTPPFDSSECPQCLTQVVTPLVSTVYSIQVEALNGCTDQDKVTVIVDRRRQIYVPNVFSPNSDGANDQFSIYAKPGTVKNILYLRVFDRWGNSLYVMEDFQPNNPTIGWDGNYRGQPMNPGVFVWVAEIEFIDGERSVYKGDVTIVR
ncbi:MAG: gliding motility-associated C-terminal domain-containing protein [Saprospiraceae bacterium]|nr:gliding motility-associated C-terminal domain-containing protein [Saprospiraceae bacterium]